MSLADTRGAPMTPFDLEAEARALVDEWYTWSESKVPSHERRMLLTSILAFVQRAVAEERGHIAQLALAYRRQDHSEYLNSLLERIAQRIEPPTPHAGGEG